MELSGRDRTHHQGPDLPGLFQRLVVHAKAIVNAGEDEDAGGGEDELGNEHEPVVGLVGLGQDGAHIGAQYDRDPTEDEEGDGGSYEGSSMIFGQIHPGHGWVSIRSRV